MSTEPGVGLDPRTLRPCPKLKAGCFTDGVAQAPPRWQFLNKKNEQQQSKCFAYFLPFGVLFWFLAFVECGVNPATSALCKQKLKAGTSPFSPRGHARTQAVCTLTATEQVLPCEADGSSPVSGTEPQTPFPNWRKAKASLECPDRLPPNLSLPSLTGY